jgi:hypothetical protein
MWRLLRVLGCGAVLLAIGSLFGSGLHSSETAASGRSQPQGSNRGGVRAISDAPSILLAQTTAKKKRGVAKKRTPATEETTKPAAEVAATPGKDSGLKFSRDIAPILANNCLRRCHNPQDRKGKLDLTTFEKLMAGSDKEKVIEPGKPDESHLVLRLRGEETPKMPQGNNNNLSQEAIEKIESWVKAGALLDPGIDRKATLESYAPTPDQLRIAELKKMSAEDRDKMVEGVGLKRWKQASPKNTPEMTPSAHFIIFGTLPKDRVTAISKAMETAYAQLHTILSRPGEQALDWPVKTSLFVFNDSTSFVEFVRTEENREIDTSETATASFGTKEPYVAVVDPLGGREDPSLSSAARKSSKSRKGSEEDTAGTERNVTGLLAEQLAIGVLKNEGKVPPWLSTGVGAYFAAAVDPRSTYVQRLRKQAYEQWRQGWTAKANDALGDESRTDGTRAVGYAIIDWMSHDPQARPRFPGFVRGMLDEGQTKLDDVIQKVFNGLRQDLLAYSGEWVGNRYGRTR